ncbi:MAG: EamA family transporter [Proteobacteria bacterium]|nr:EamA family transporter [Desulfocapsa sp.]MBU3943321.1 EamA family transporter [Pseudomonadota bacterium]MCG2744519.1 EamA family transporter [Desulfobacteraceae bacterium]MBU4028478.1 EamA family transporter [Pseudomonadota bacterium]MBU4043640.1 EamA family transporter [Pseudomonadota bacterium]
MSWKENIRQPGVRTALGAALLFGAGTPIAKLLLNSVSPWLLAGLLYFGSGVGLTIYRKLIHTQTGRLSRADIPWLAGAILAGGIIGPVLLMMGLTGMTASSASLLMNAEGVFTALLAWFIFKENISYQIALGMTTIVAGAVILSWPDEILFEGLWPAFAVLGACFAWGVDNNLTRQISLSDATWIASIKGLAAGSVNLTLAFALGATMPPLPNIAITMVVGFLAYGVSLTLFVISLRHLGTARTGAYFSVAPFFGAVLAIAIGEPVTVPLLIAGGLMILGIWLHLTERHEHEHTHEVLGHEHEILPDEHHQHLPKAGHHHQHNDLKHTHPHFPDAHHRHDH